ncbi:MAG: hypothetical protein VX589_20840 [Myxococcota bacterium]|nr:hypothetical protein [Myxococcota bacterium]
MSDSKTYDEMRAALNALRDKQPLKDLDQAHLAHRLMRMTQSLGALSTCISDEKSRADMATEAAELLVHLMGLSLQADFDLEAAFWTHIKQLERRTARMAEARIRVSMHGGESDSKGGFKARVARAIDARISISNRTTLSEDAEER